MRQKIGILLCLLILTACGGQNETEYPEEAKGEESRWSEWSEALPLDIRDNKEYQIETMTRYRSRSLTTLESERELKESDGYILKDEISEWSEWSEWSRQKVTATPDREVERREAQSSDVYDSSKKQYRYSRWTQFSNGSGWSGPTQGVWSGIECDYYQETEWLDEPLEKDSEQTDSNGDVYILFLGENGVWYNEETRGGEQADAGKVEQYNYSRYTEFADGKGWTGPSEGYWSGIYCGNYQEKGWSDEPLPVLEVQWKDGVSFNVYEGYWYNESTRDTDEMTIYEYRYRDLKRTYYYSVWSEWSEWSPIQMNPTDTSEVETKDYYRYRLK